MAAAVSGVGAAGLGAAHPAACYAGHGCSGLCALRGKLLYHAAAGRALSAVGPDAGVRSRRCGLCCRAQAANQHGGLHCAGAGTDGGKLLCLPRAAAPALAAKACGHRCFGGGAVSADLRRLLTARSHAGFGHHAGCMDAGPLLSLLRCTYRFYDQPHQSGDRQARGLLGAGGGRYSG